MSEKVAEIVEKIKEEPTGEQGDYFGDGKAGEKIVQTLLNWD